MGLEGRLTAEQAEAIFERKKDLLRSIGKEEEELDFFLAETKEDYNRYKLVYHWKKQWGSGKKEKNDKKGLCTRISKQIGINFDTVWSWGFQGRIPSLLHFESQFSKQRMQFSRTIISAPNLRCENEKTTNRHK